MRACECSAAQQELTKHCTARRRGSPCCSFNPAAAGCSSYVVVVALYIIDPASPEPNDIRAPVSHLQRNSISGLHALKFTSLSSLNAHKFQFERRSRFRKQNIVNVATSDLVTLSTSEIRRKGTTALYVSRAVHGRQLHRRQFSMY